MNTLILVPLDNTYVNPAEIAAISPNGFTKESTVITLRNNQIAVTINWPVEKVIERLQNHFAPTNPEEGMVVDATNILKYAASSFPDSHDPIRLAMGIKDIVGMLAKSKDWQNAKN